jgi:glycosyltransferase involved in cell wall biosynthesis
MSAMDAAETKRHTRAAARLSALLSRLVPQSIVCNSQSALDDHAALGFDRGRMAVIPNGVDSVRFRPDVAARRSVREELGLDDQGLLVGLVGRWDPQKDHRTFLEAFAVLVAHNPNVHAVLCGQDVDSVRPLIVEVGGHQLNRKVHVMGSRTDIETITAALDVAVSSSAYGESFPNAIAEAMACEVPVVVTDLPGSVALVGDVGRVVPVGDSRALADATAGLLADCAARRRLGAAGRARVIAQWDVRVSHDRYLDVYAAARAGRRRD